MASLASLQGVDWNSLWQTAQKKRSWQGKKKEDWNRRAVSFARRNSRSAYGDNFLEKVAVRSEETVLDVGSGPGTLSIPLAKEACKVTALDFSSEMLDVLQKRLRSEKLTNVMTVEGSWEDDWHALGVEPHDLVIASRSLAVQDLKAALIKLNTWALKRVVLSERVGGGPFDPAIFRAVGRDFQPGPDYIYTVNILYQMGILARVDFIESGGVNRYKDPLEAYEAWAWMLDQMSGVEEQRLKRHIEKRVYQNSDGSWSLENQIVPKWALIQWEVDRC